MAEQRDRQSGVSGVLSRDGAGGKSYGTADPYAVDAAEKWRPFLERDVSAPDEAWFAQHLGGIHTALGYVSRLAPESGEGRSRRS